MKILFILIISFNISIFAQDKEIKNLFEGKWKMESGKTEIYEEWTVVNDDELKAEAYTIIGNNKKITELLYIKKFGNHWAYIGIPGKQKPTLFTLLSFEGNQFIFENKEHDFPQRIIYYFFDEGKLTATVEGEVDGKLKHEVFNFTLVK